MLPYICHCQGRIDLGTAVNTNRPTGMYFQWWCLSKSSGMYNPIHPSSQQCPDTDRLHRQDFQIHDFCLKNTFKNKKIRICSFTRSIWKIFQPIFLHGHRCGACDEYRAGLLNKREGKSEGLRILASLPKLPFQSSLGYWPSLPFHPGFLYPAPPLANRPR